MLNLILEEKGERKIRFLILGRKGIRNLKLGIRVYLCSWQDVQILEMGLVLVT